MRIHCFVKGTVIVIITWLIQIRANFLALAVILVMIGGAAAWSDNAFNPFLFVLTVIGVTLAHVSVNLFNEYSDWKTGIDFMTNRTAFSGGTGTLQAGKLAPGTVRMASWVTLLSAFLIGCYLAYESGWPVIVFMVIGGVVAVTYTDYLARYMLGEFASGLTLGSFVVIGTYFVQTETISPSIVWASIPPGLLTMALLYLNEFPDLEADTRGGRRHLIIVLGRRRAAYGYAIIMAAVYASLIMGVVNNSIPKLAIMGVMTLPVAMRAVVKTLRYYDDMAHFVPALALNVVAVLVTDLLLAVGFLLA